MDKNELTFYDGHYFVEDVAAARISSILHNEGIDLTDDQKNDIARTIMGAVVGYMIGSDHYQDFVKCRIDRWMD